MSQSDDVRRAGIATIGSEIDLVRVADVIWTRKWLVGGIMLACGALAATYALLATPIYRAEVVVTDARNGSMGAAASLTSQFGGLASLAGIDLNGGDASKESRAVLKSRELIEDFIVLNKLTDRILPRSDAHRSTWRAVEQFRKNILTIREDNRASTLIVSVDWEDPKVAANWANSFVALANDIIRKRALDEANRNVAYLNEQLKNTSSIEVQKVMYHLIETETKNSMLASGRTQYAFTVVDSATPPELRLSPKRTLIVIGGLMTGFILGSLLALLRGKPLPKV